MSTEDNAEGEVKIPEEEAEIETLESIQALAPEKEVKEETVPLKKYMSEKRDRQEAEARETALVAEVNRLKTNMVNMPVGAVTDAIKKLSEKHDVSEDFLADVFSTAQTLTEEKLRAEMDKEIKPMANQMRMEKAEQKFKEHLEKELKLSPEYAELINVDVVKAVAVNPANAKKTMAQILDEIYGKAVKGRKTLESAHPSRNEEVDFNRGSENDFEKINADPDLKKKWSKDAEDQIRAVL